MSENRCILVFLILDPILSSDESDAVEDKDLRLERKIIKAQNSRYNQMYPSS